MLTNLFKEEVIVVRSTGFYLDGDWVEGDEDIFPIKATVQPAPAEVMEILEEGDRTKSAFILFTNTELNTSIVNQSNADYVFLYGEKYFVVKKSTRRSTILSHYEIVVVKGESDAG